MKDSNKALEIDLLRNDTKSLLHSLKQHQSRVFNSFNKLKETEKISPLVEKNSTIENSESLKSKILERNPSCDSMEPGKIKNLKKNNNVKTVSFSDYLRTCNVGGRGLVVSPRRISKSVSPHSKTGKKTKSILKKQLVQDELSDDDNMGKKSNSSSTSSVSMSTNSLLSLNIYGEHFYESDEFDDNLKDIFRYRETNQNFLTHSNGLNDSSFIEFIAKKRQAYLNHVYNSSSNLNLNQIESLDEKKTTNKNSITDVSHWSRTLSADGNRRSRSRSKSFNKKIATSVKNSYKREKSETNKTKQDTSETKSRKKSPNKIRNYKKIARQMKKNRPLLGYDWALDALDTKLNTTTTKYEKPEEFWQDLNSFRNQHKEDCISSKQINFDGTASSFFEMDSKQELGAYCDKKNEEDGEDDGRNHKCIHSYTLNERLFPVPIYKGKNGQSMCPVCKSTKKEATSYSPQFCKISIPKSRIIEPYKIEPNKRSQTNPEDTLSLAEHCIAGFQNAPKKGSKMYSLPKSKNVDLKSATGIKNEFTKLTIDDVKRIAANKDPATSGIYNKGNAMRYDLEDQHLKRLKEFAPKNC